MQSTITDTTPDFEHEQFKLDLFTEMRALRGRELPGFSNTMFFHVICTIC